MSAEAEDAPHGPPRRAQDSLPLPDVRSRRVVRLVFAVALVLLGIRVAQGFLAALAWAVVITIAAWPFYQGFAARLPERGRAVLAPLLFTLLTGLVLLLPLAFAAVQVGRQGQVLLQWVAEAQQSGIPVPDWLLRLPIVGEHVHAWWRTYLSNPDAVGNLLGRIDKDTLTAWTRLFGAQLLRSLLLFFVTLMALFLLLRDGAWIGERLLAHADRWLGDPGERLAGKMVTAVRGTVNGTVLVALGEGLLIGIAYVAAGVPHATLFALLTTGLAMVPFGAWAAFAAASLVLLVQGGGALMAAGLFAFGAVVMVVGDHVVQPALVGGAARLPFLWALIGIFGGLEAFGLVGLFLGPVIMAALLIVWREWIDRPVPGEPRGR